MKIAKPLTLLTKQQVKFEWTPGHQEAFMKLKDSIIQAPILCYPNPSKKYFIYTDTSDDACRANTGTQWHGISNHFPVSHFLRNPEKVEYDWARGLWSLLCHNQMYYLQGADNTVRNDNKPLVKFLNGENANNKVNRWGLELATYNITFKWISGAKNKTADCLITPSWTAFNAISINQHGISFK